jgi:hypothetical protein
LAGTQLALGSRDTNDEKAERFVVLTTVLHVGVAVLYGIANHHAARRGWLRL